VLYTSGSNLWLLREQDVTKGSHFEDRDQHVEPLPVIGRQKHLKGLWNSIVVHDNTTRWTKSLRRICQSCFYGQYFNESQAFNERQRGLCEAAYHEETQSISLSQHPIEEYLDVCFPETTLVHGDIACRDAIEACAKAKRRFKNAVQERKPWVMMNERYDKGIFPLLPRTLHHDE
jgi:hypothetical protein